MTGESDFAYAQARIQARHGTRLTEIEWRRLEATHDTAQYLHVLRATGRARWIERIAPDMSCHALEARLRAEWRAYVNEVAHFLPDPWRPALAWTAFLVDLPVVDHLLRGDAVHSWMADDEIYAPWCRTDAYERHGSLQASPLAALLQEARSGTPTLRAWFVVWRRLWPRTSTEQARALEEILWAVAEHSVALREAEAPPSAELRLALKLRLCTLFRRHFETAAATVAHLLLEALDLERLRAGLVRRALLETASAVAA